MTPGTTGGKPPSEDWTSSAWIGVGILGALVFVVGVYVPALRGVPYSREIGYGLAAAGGALVVLGFTLASRARDAVRSRPPTELPLESLPGVEVYAPGDSSGRRPSGDAPKP